MCPFFKVAKTIKHLISLAFNLIYQWKNKHNLAHCKKLLLWKCPLFKVAKWVPSRVGVPGNEAADRLAKAVHSNPAAPVCEAISAFDAARHILRHKVPLCHPDPRVASGKLPRPVPYTAFGRAAYSLLLHIRIGCVFTADRRHRLMGEADTNCIDCGETETVEHLLCECPVHANVRSIMRAEYSKLGLPSATAGDPVFPEASPHKRKAALSALVSFVDEAGLRRRI
ncbi:uncharacterized protein LOC144100244 [Amblyomma americanum]